MPEFASGSISQNQMNMIDFLFWPCSVNLALYFSPRMENWDTDRKECASFLVQLRMVVGGVGGGGGGGGGWISVH